MRWLQQTDPRYPNPPVTRKGDQFIKTGSSIRQDAKELFQSQVGEVYDANHLSALARQYGFSDSTIVEAESNYAKT